METHQILSHFAGRVWAIDAQALQAVLGAVRLPRSGDTRGAPFQGAERVSSLRVGQDGVARIRIEGLLMPEVPKVLRWFGVAATAYQDIEQDVADALADDRVKSLRLLVSSPGGLTSGVEAAVGAVQEAARRLPTSARITEIGASAAYWIASQAGRIDASPTALVGAIGAYAVLTDMSAMAASLGLKIHVLRTGPHKGAGVPGSEVTPEQLAPFQRLVDDVAAMFKADVAAGRRRPAGDVEAWATGEAWLAGRARDLGLIDEVTSPKLARPASSKQAKPKARAAAGLGPCLSCGKNPRYSADSTWCRPCVDDSAADARRRGEAAERARADAEAREARACAEAEEAEQRAHPCPVCKAGGSRAIHLLDGARESRECVRCGTVFKDLSTAARAAMKAGAKLSDLVRGGA